MYEILEIDGKFKCTLSYQDGVDQWHEKDRKTAVEEMIRAAKYYNRKVITESDINQLVHFSKKEHKIMTKNLYHIQDDDRPMYVVGTSWQDALKAWQRVIGAENNHPPEEADPTGITLIAKDEELIS